MVFRFVYVFEFISGDSAYPCMDWLIPPFRGEVHNQELRFNNAHAKIRNTVERAFGVLKRRFFSLATGLRIRDMKLAAKLIICAMIVHNKCLAMGDFAEDFEDLQDPMALQHDWIADPNDDRTAGQQRRQSLLEALCGQ